MANKIKFPMLLQLVYINIKDYGRSQGQITLTICRSGLPVVNVHTLQHLSHLQMAAICLSRIWNATRTAQWCNCI